MGLGFSKSQTPKQNQVKQLSIAALEQEILAAKSAESLANCISMHIENRQNVAAVFTSNCSDRRGIPCKNKVLELLSSCGLKPTVIKLALSYDFAFINMLLSEQLDRQMDPLMLAYLTAAAKNPNNFLKKIIKNSRVRRLLTEAPLKFIHDLESQLLKSNYSIRKTTNILNKLLQLKFTTQPDNIKTSQETLSLEQQLQQQYQQHQCIDASEGSNQLDPKMLAQSREQLFAVFTSAYLTQYIAPYRPGSSSNSEYVLANLFKYRLFPELSNTDDNQQKTQICYTIASTAKLWHILKHGIGASHNQLVTASPFFWAKNKIEAAIKAKDFKELQAHFTQDSDLTEFCDHISKKDGATTRQALTQQRQESLAYMIVTDNKLWQAFKPRLYQAWYEPILAFFSSAHKISYQQRLFRAKTMLEKHALFARKIQADAKHKDYQPELPMPKVIDKPKPIYREDDTFGSIEFDDLGQDFDQQEQNFRDKERVNEHKLPKNPLTLFSQESSNQTVIENSDPTSISSIP